MTKIIKHGIKPEQKEPYNLVFRCQYCGCEFCLDYPQEKAQHKVEDTRLYYDDYWEAVCPECALGARSVRKLGSHEVFIN